MKNTIQSDLIRGHINTIILKALYDGDRYSYDIIREIEQKSSGQYKLKQPTLYSCLKRLEIQGFIRSYWGAQSSGGRRKYYTLTEMGRELFIKNQSEWEYSRTVIDKLISDKEVDLNTASPVFYDEDTELEQDELEQDDLEQDNLEQDDLEQDELEQDDLEQDELEQEEAEQEELEDLRLEEAQQEDLEREEAQQEEYSPEQAQTEQSPTTADDALSEQENSGEQDTNEPNTEEQDTEEQADAEREIAAAAQPEQPVNEPITFADTSALMDELFKMHQADSTDGSYVDKIVADKYVSDRTDEGMSADLYFKDFFDEAESVREAIQAVADEEEQDSPLIETYVPDGGSQTNTPPPFIYPTTEDEPNRQTQSSEEQPPESDPVPQTSGNGFLNYHTSQIVPEPENNIIEREYRSILGEFLNPCFIERTPPEPIPQPREEQPPEPAAEQPQMPITDAEDAVPQNNEQYTTDVDVNRKLNGITEAVRQMGDNVTIRTHNASSAQEYNSAYHYYANKLMLAHYGILFAVMMVEILFTAVFVNLILHQGQPYDKWIYVLGTLLAAVFPIVAFVKNFNDPDRQKRINFNVKNSLIYRFIVMAQCLLIIYCANVIAGMPLGFSSKYITSLLLPSLLSLCFPISALIFNALFKSRKYSVEQ